MIHRGLKTRLLFTPAFWEKKSLFFKKDVDTEKILESNKITSGEKSYKYFIGYFNDHNVKPLQIILPKTSAYVKFYDGQTKTDVFLI